MPFARCKVLVLQWLVYVVCASCTACDREAGVGLIVLEKADSAAQYSIRPTVQFMDSAFLRARLTAGWARMYAGAQEKHLGGGLRVEFFNRAGQLASILTADSALVEDKTSNMVARGNVVVVSGATPSNTVSSSTDETPVSSQTTVRTSIMHWNQAKQVLHSAEFVDIASPNELLQGYGFESDPNLQHYTIYKVTGQTLLAGGLAMTATTATATAATASSTAKSVNSVFSTSPSTKGEQR
jgi:LPS export ABC transporter protein LptC